jgi:restriction system protein
MKVFVVRASYGKFTEVFRNHGYAGIGWLDNPLNDISDKKEITDFYLSKFPDHSRMQIRVNVGQIYRFLNEIKIGSIVLTPFSDPRFIIGKVTGKPFFCKDNTSPFNYRLGVNWQDRIYDKKELSIAVQRSLGGSLSVYNIMYADKVFESIS